MPWTLTTPESPPGKGDTGENLIGLLERSDTKVFANYWLHNAFITMSNEKMAKSQGNILKIKDFRNKISGQILRLALMSAHYKQPLDCLLRNDIKKDVFIEKLSVDELNIIKYGIDEILDFIFILLLGNRYRKVKLIDGILIKIENRYLEISSEEIRIWYKKFMLELVCVECKGVRLNL